MPEQLAPTPAQTVGPYFAIGLSYPRDNQLSVPGGPDTIVLHGTVVDGAGEPIPDCLIELWQRDAQGNIVQQAGSLQRDGATFTGFGRCGTDGEGRYRFFTQLPGAVDGVAFFSLAVFARGLLDRVFTRAYLPSEAIEDNEFLQSLPPQRRQTLLVDREDERTLRFDIALQGDQETVFLQFDDTVRG